MGETLEVRIEENNEHDRFAVSALREDEIIGHVPQEISRLFSSFFKLRRSVNSRSNWKENSRKRTRSTLSI